MKKLMITLLGAAVCWAQTLFADDPVYDLEYETASGWVQVEESVSSFKTAVDNVKAGGTIRLLKDVTSNGTYTILPKKTLTVDGQGYTLTVKTRFTYGSDGKRYVNTLKNMTITTAGETLSDYMFLIRYGGTLVLDNVNLSNINLKKSSGGGQIFRLWSGTARIKDSTLSTLTGSCLFRYEQTNGKDTYCGATGYTNRVEIVRSTISGVSASTYPLADLSRTTYYPSVLEMTDSSIAGCTSTYGISYSDDGSNAYLPECRIDGCSITNNTFSTAALGVSVTGAVCRVEMSGETYVKNNTEDNNTTDIVVSGRPEGLVVRDVTGDVRFKSPATVGVTPFARPEGTLMPTAFKIASRESSYAFLHDGLLYWTATDAIYMDGWPYGSSAAAERTARANGKYVFKSSDAFVSKSLAERGEGDVRYVTVGGEFIPEATAAESYAFRVSNGTTNSWTGCADLSAAITALKGHNSVVELLKDVNPDVSFSVGYANTVCGAGHTWMLTGLENGDTTRIFQNTTRRQTFTDIVVDGSGIVRKGEIYRANRGSSVMLELGPGAVFRNITTASGNNQYASLAFIATGQGTGGQIVMRKGSLIENCKIGKAANNIFLDQGSGIDIILEGGTVRGCTANGLCRSTSDSTTLKIGSVTVTNNTFSGEAAISVRSTYPATVSGCPVILDNATSAGAVRGLKIANAADFTQVGDILEGAYVTVQCEGTPALGTAFGTWQAGTGTEAFHPSSKPKYFGKVEDDQLVWDRVRKGLILILQ